MNEPGDNSEFERRIGELLRASADDLDGATRSRLTQARYRALEQRAARRQHNAWRSFAPAGGVALAVLLTLGYVSRHGVDAPLVAVNEEPGAAVDDLLLLADNDIVDMGQDADYDFFAWAADGGDDAPVGS